MNIMSYFVRIFSIIWIVFLFQFYIEVRSVIEVDYDYYHVDNDSDDEIKDPIPSEYEILVPELTWPLEPNKDEIHNAFIIKKRNDTSNKRISRSANQEILEPIRNTLDKLEKVSLNSRWYRLMAEKAVTEAR